MSRWQRAWWRSWPCRWLRSLSLFARGVRQHSSVVLLGHAAQFVLARGVVLDAGVKLSAGARGRVQLGEQVWLARGTEVETESQVRIGSGTTIQRRCSLNGNVRIGRGCILAPNVFISSGSHPFRDPPHLPIREQERLAAAAGSAAARNKPVTVQDDCWLGVNVVLAPGVTLGKGCIVGANAVVTHDVAPYSVVAGTPARPIGERLTWLPPRALELARIEQHIYVLSGAPAHANGVLMGVAVVAEEPFVAALDATVGEVEIAYVASGEASVVASGLRSVVRGTGTLRVALLPAQRAGGHARVELAIDAGSASKSLVVLGLRSVEPAAAAHADRHSAAMAKAIQP